MIKPEQIPDEVVEAAVTAWLEKASDYTRLNESIRAAIAAALAAWPEMHTAIDDDEDSDDPPTRLAIILPLPKDAADE
jgi:hypothetical protein